MVWDAEVAPILTLLDPGRNFLDRHSAGMRGNLVIATELRQPLEVPVGRKDDPPVPTFAPVDHVLRARPKHMNAFCRVGAWLMLPIRQADDIEARVIGALVSIFRIWLPAGKWHEAIEIERQSRVVEGAREARPCQHRGAQMSHSPGHRKCRKADSKADFLKRFPDRGDASSHFIDWESGSQLLRQFAIGWINRATRENQRARRKNHACGPLDQKNVCRSMRPVPDDNRRSGGTNGGDYGHENDVAARP